MDVNGISKPKAKKKQETRKVSKAQHLLLSEDKFWQNWVLIALWGNKEKSKPDQNLSEVLIAYGVWGI